LATPPSFANGVGDLSHGGVEAVPADVLVHADGYGRGGVAQHLGDVEHVHALIEADGGERVPQAVQGDRRRTPSMANSCGRSTDMASRTGSVRSADDRSTERRMFSRI
jgi:hypothetical protein